MVILYQIIGVYYSSNTSYAHRSNNGSHKKTIKGSTPETLFIVSLSMIYTYKRVIRTPQWHAYTCNITPISCFVYAN